MASYLSRPSSPRYGFDIPTREWEKRRRDEDIPGTSAGVTPFIPTFERERKIDFEKEDVQALGKADAAELSRIALLGDVERAKELQEARNRTNSLGTILSAITGESFTRSATVALPSAPKTQTAQALTTERFTSNMWELLRNNPKLTETEMIQFLDTQNAGSRELEVFKKAVSTLGLSLGKLVPLFKMEDGDLKRIYRRENADHTTELAAGWKLKLDGIKFQRELDKGAVEKQDQDRIATLNQSINQYGGPTTAAEYKTWLKAKGVLRPAVQTYFDSRFSHLKEADAPVWHSRIRLGEREYKMLQPSAATTVEEGQPVWEKMPSGADVVQDRNLAQQNEIIDTVMLTAFAEKPFPGRIPSLLEVQSIARTKAKNDLNVAVSDWGDFDDMVKKRYNKEYRDEEKARGEITLVNQKLPAMTSWKEVNKFISDNNLGEKSAKYIREGFEKSNPGIEWTGTSQVWNEFGELFGKEIKSYADLLDAESHGFRITEWDDVTNKPETVINHSLIDQNQDIVHMQGTLRKFNPDFDDTIDESETNPKYIEEQINEPRWTVSGEKRHYKEVKNEAGASLQAIKHVREYTSQIFQDLSLGTAEGDGFAVKRIEKLLDPTGVVRQSDVDFLKSFGSIRQEMKTFIQNLLRNEKVFFQPTQRRNLAEVVQIVYDTITNSNTEQLGYLKELMDSDPYNLEYGGKLDFFRVIPKTQWEDLHSYDVGAEFTPIVEGAGGTTTADLADRVSGVETMPVPEIIAEDTIPESEIVEEGVIPEGLTKEATLRSLLSLYEEQGNTMMAAQVRRRLTELGY